MNYRRSNPHTKQWYPNIFPQMALARLIRQALTTITT